MPRDMRAGAGQTTALTAAFRAPRLTAAQEAAIMAPFEAIEAMGRLGRARSVGRQFRQLQRAFAPRVAEAEAPSYESAASVEAHGAGPASDSMGARSRTLAAFSEESRGAEKREVKAPAAAAADPAPKTKSGAGLLSLGSAAVFFIASLVTAQIGIEALGSAMPALLQKTFGDFSVVADIAIVSSLTSIAGRILGPLVVEKFGLKGTYLGALAIKLVSSSTLSALLATGHMSVPLLAAFYALNGLLGGISLTAENSIPAAMLKRNPDKLETFEAWKQTLLETMGTLGPIATGALVAQAGFIPALAAFPVTFGLSIAIMAFTLRLPSEEASAGRAAVEIPKGKEKHLSQGGFAALLRQFFKKIAEGARLVWNDPVLRLAFLAYTTFMMLNPFLYTVLAPAYGMLVATPAQPELAAGVYGLMTGLYSLGGLIGGLIMLAQQRKMERELGRARASPEVVEEHMRKSMLQWMLWATAALAALAVMAVPLPTLGELVNLPGFLSWAKGLTAAALVLVPFGIAQVVATLKIHTFFQLRTSEEHLVKAMGFMGAASLAVSTVGLLGLKFLFTGKLPFGLHPVAAFSGLSGYAPFMVLAAGLIPLGIFALLLRAKLDKASA